MIVELLEKYFEEPTIPVIGDSASIVALCGEIIQGVEGDIVIIVENVLKLPATDFEVCLVELVEDIPAYGSEVASFSEESMEEGQTHEEFLVVFGLESGFPVGLFVLAVEDGGVDVQDGCFDPPSLSLAHFQTVLQQLAREPFARTAGQPQAEFAVALLISLVQLAQKLLQLPHPLHRQMAILKQHPIPHARTFYYVPLRNTPLSLTQRNRHYHTILLLSQFLQLLLRVLPSR